MNRNFGRALSCVLEDEGGFVNDPHDPGGATNKGITLATFRRYVAKNATVDDLKHLTTTQAAKVYRKQYWDAVKGDDLPDGVDYAVFDFAVNSGQSRAAKYLQTIIGVPADGKIGPQTLAAVRATDARAVINMLCDRRLSFLQGLKTWPRYKNGWTDRVHGVRETALEMVTSVSPTPSPVPPPPDLAGAQKTAGYPHQGTTPKPSNPKASSPKTGDLGTTPKTLATAVGLILAGTAAFWATATDGWQHLITLIERIF